MKHVTQIFSMRASASREVRAARDLREQAAEERRKAGAFLESAERHEREAAEAEAEGRAWNEIANSAFAASVPNTGTFLAALTSDQRKGNHCCLCGGDITDAYPDERLGDIDGHYLFAHVNRTYCDAVAAKRDAAAQEEQVA